MKIISTLVLLLGLQFYTPIFGQGETSNWFFGNGAGISFNNDGSVTPISDGQLDTYEGCATISNSFGELLFYTDGIIVYDKNHEVMQNGDKLLGDPSSTQSALIVPKPGDQNIYYIFTVDTSPFENDPDLGLNYSIVDISKNGGKGAVTKKNIRLLNDCSEKIAAVVKDCSEKSIWLLTFSSIDGITADFNTFHAFEINTTGVENTSVKSTFSDLNITDPRGYLKISPDGSKIANANMSGGLFIYDFNAVSGKLTSQEKVFISGSNKAPYGVEFSPSSQFLYIHASTDIFADSGHRSSLLQFDIASSNISDSQEILDTRSIYRGALQLGENGKIYRTTAKNYYVGTPFLSVINNPNLKGDKAGYEHDKISLNGKSAAQGLPPFIQSFFNKIALAKNSDGTKSSTLAICSNESINLEVELVSGATYTWQKDGKPIANSSNSLHISSANTDDSGKYTLSVQLANSSECPIIGEALVNVAPLPEVSSATLEQCDVDNNINDGFTIFDLTQVAKNQSLDYKFFETQIDLTDDNPIQNPENYPNSNAFSQTVYYTISNELGCSGRGQITLIINSVNIVANTESPISICNVGTENDQLIGTLDLDILIREKYQNLEVAFYSTLSDAVLEDNPLNGILKTEKTTIYIRYESTNQCQSIETIDINITPLPVLNLQESYEVCSDANPLIIKAPLGYDTYTWYKIDGDKSEEIGLQNQINITNGGSYELEVGLIHENSFQNKSCVTTANFIVNESNRAILEEIEIEEFSNQNSILVIVSGQGDYEFSLDGFTYQNEAFFDNIEPGFYTVFVRDKKGCGISEKEIAVLGFPKFFTPNSDGYNDTWNLIGAAKDMVSGSISIHDRYGKLLQQVDAHGDGWNGNFIGQILPSDDYWFKLTLTDGREFNGHFTLKR